MPQPQSVTREFLSGNEAIAKGFIAADAACVIGYPGTPATEIIETLRKQQAQRTTSLFAHWAVNEKVAFEMALGAALSGVRAAVAMKHVGLNVAADALMSSAYAGVNGGFVIVSADDPNMYSSQNEQDNRHYARFAKIPMLEPSDSTEAFHDVRLAFELSERFNTPVLLRVTMRVCHSYSIVDHLAAAAYQLPAEFPYPPKETATAFNKQDPRTIMLPSIARRRHQIVETRLSLLAKLSAQLPINRVENAEATTATLLVTAGIAYQYIRENFSNVPILKLGFSYPLSGAWLRKLSSTYQQLIVIEELDPFLEQELLFHGVPFAKLRRRAKSFYLGELSPERTRALILTNREPAQPNPHAKQAAAAQQPSPNPPRLCPGCPHLTIANLLRELDMVVSGDIGCYTLAALEPFNSLHTVIDMGASIPIMLGMQLGKRAQHAAALRRSTARHDPAPTPEAADTAAKLPLALAAFQREQTARIAVIGDSTFLHSGMPGLLEASALSPDGVICLLDNATTAMTGQQTHAGQQTIRTAQPVQQRVDYIQLAHALGIRQTHLCDPYQFQTARETLHRALGESGISFVVFQRACALLKPPPQPSRSTQPTTNRPTAAQQMTPLQTVAEVNANCVQCGECLRVGCPSISFNTTRGRPEVDASSCIGCGICPSVCDYDALGPKLTTPPQYNIELNAELAALVKQP